MQWMKRWYVAVLPAAIAIALMFAAAPAAVAQPCSADVQCQRLGPATQAVCSGDTLVVRRSYCQGGQCRDVEEVREVCGSRSTASCTAGGVARTTSRCDGLLARCVTRTDIEPCYPSCTCRGKRLTVSSGTCLSALGCQRSTLTCAKGCTCDPEPKCL